MLLSFKIERVVIQVDSSKWMTCLLKAIILRVRDEWETAKAWKKVRPVLHPGEDWGGHGFSLPFLPSTVTCDLVPSLRKQLNYVSETMFWPCWNRSSKIQVLWGSYYTADTARELSCGLNFLTVYSTAAQRRWKHWEFAAVKTDCGRWVKYNYFFSQRYVPLWGSVGGYGKLWWRFFDDDKEPWHTRSKQKGTPCLIFSCSCTMDWLIGKKVDKLHLDYSPAF